MPERQSTAPEAVVPSSSSARHIIPSSTTRRLQWAIPHSRNLPNELSPAATSAPIPISGRMEETTRRYRSSSCHQPAPWVPVLPRGNITPAPSHSHLDSITDYCLPDTHGWESARKCRLKRGEEQTGKILAGRWPPATPWDKPVVVRKDVDFRKEEQDRLQRWAVTGWANSMYQDGTMGAWIW
ncbi:hypothetical protein BDU57DRAFT_90616 [Ampelomyces quisqualis]|uniref:Uncharacterized protein n=1 Tax=Ampelomyces quisqualis TaxID=50730 RepID=A0A6A5Q8Y2_AMPQU|nr:hypothetical protein BDU57DRAFT_90616 [Ampelomyces quisqualis]